MKLREGEAMNREAFLRWCHKALKKADQASFEAAMGILAS